MCTTQMGGTDICSGSIVDGEAEEKDKEENQSSQHANGNHQEENQGSQDANGYHQEENQGSQDVLQYEHSSFQLDVNEEEYPKENNVQNGNTNMENTEDNGLEEHITLRGESESEEATKQKKESEVVAIADGSMSHTQHTQEKLPDTFPGGDDSKPAQKHISLMTPQGNGIVCSPDAVPSKSEKANISVDKKHTVSKNRQSRISQSSNGLPKGLLEATTRNSMNGNVKCKRDAEEVCQSQRAGNLPASNRLLRRTGNTRYTVPQPFALATDKRASTSVRPIDGEIAEAAPIANNIISPSIVKKPQLVKTTSTPVCSKSSHSESSKLQDQNVKPPTQANLNNDEEDNCSITSSTSTPRKATKERPRSAASVPSFRCDERAEKRKAFFSKIEEKLHVKELEKSELQAKSKEKQEAEIRQLRKIMTFKATPMPSFYHEAPPPKVELKKIPPTRAKSPKLGRRNSCVGVESQGDCIQSFMPSSSTLNQIKSNGTLQELTADKNTEKGVVKDNASAKKTLRRSLTKAPSVKQPVKSKLNEMPVSLKEEALTQLETTSAIRSTKNSNHTSSPSNTLTNASDDQRGNLEGSQAVKEKDNGETSNGHNEIAEDMANNNKPRESDEPRLDVRGSEAPRERASVESLDGHNEMVYNNREESDEIAEIMVNNNQPLDGHNEIIDNDERKNLDDDGVNSQESDAAKEKGEIAHSSKQNISDEDEVNLQVSDTVKEKGSAKPLDMHIEIAEVNINRDEARDSCSLVAAVKAPETGKAELADLQDSDASKFKRNGGKLLLSSKVQKKEKTHCNGAVVNGAKSKSVRSSQEVTIRESSKTNGKGIQNLGRDRLKAMTQSVTSSKRESVKSVSLKRTGKESRGMAQVVGDVVVQS